MAVSDSFLTFVIEQLDGVRQVTSRRMFGGVGLYSGESFFGVLDNDRLYFKVNETSVGDYTRAGMGPFRPDPTKPMTMKYYEVPVSVLEDRDAIAAWARKAIAVAEGAKGAKGAKGARLRRGAGRT
jgi:DNA transformation protein